MRTEILEVNGYDIVLPIGMEQTLETKVRDSYQSFLTDSTKDVRRHLTCLTTLLPPALNDNRPVDVLHAFGGVGASAQVILRDHPHSNHHFLERDPNLVEYLRSYFPNESVAFVQDSMKFLTFQFMKDFDVILLDMSVGTIKTKGVKEMWDEVSKVVWDKPETVIWFTDTACHKIHLNYKSYSKDFGVEVLPTAESYLDAYDNYLRTMGLTITAAMREAGEFYCVVKTSRDNNKFSSIPYV